MGMIIETERVSQMACAVKLLAISVGFAGGNCRII